ncbi:MarR family winged helix-turn-helix transcriptional regulator [Candidatus Solirubrobacter pratensis]|uniref:MarR family winged helix-turn-helix transcriptional regulator n=1 Tax=Candidatus Solirubrobacter pratensis TaxID=1298857 RepID=UPI00040EDCD7|nr:MarR family transcriptional regulator [Candidatus Solirubrobacter pratensis]
MQATVASAQRLSELLAPLWAYLNRKSSAELFEMVAELDSSFSQVKMMFLLEDGGEHSVKEIATHLGLSLPAASRAVDGLIQRGWVTRRESAEDRRSRLVALTDDGRAVVDRVLRARLKTLERFAEELTPQERDGLAKALLPIVERIAPS